MAARIRSINISTSIDTRRPADNARSWSGLTVKLKNCQSDMLQEEHVACLARGQTGEMV